MNISTPASKTYNSHFLIILLTILMLTISNASAATKVSLNGSAALDIKISSDSVHSNYYLLYDYSITSKEVKFLIDTPIVCAQSDSAASNIVLKTKDSNELYTLGDLNNVTYDGLSSFVYNISTGIISIKTVATTFCATESGVHVNRDLIYRYGFEEDGNLNDLEIKLYKNDVPSDDIVFDNSSAVSDNQVLRYRYEVTNNGNLTQFFKLVEFHQINNASTSYLTSISGSAFDWSCEITNDAGSSQNFCDFNPDQGNSNDIDGDDLTLLNAALQPGATLTVSASKLVEFPAGMTVGTESSKLELLAAVFPTMEARPDALLDNNVVYQEFATSNNTPPTISAVSIPAFAEDSQSNVVGFTVDDVNMDNNLIVVSATSSDTSIVPDGNITIAGTGSNRTIQITPATDANTETNSVTITIVADDGITTTTSNVNVTINPVNDAPLFAFVCTDNIVDSQTGVISCNDSGISTKALTINNFITNISMGNTFDDDAQAVSNYIVTLDDDPNGIIHTGIGGPSISIDAISNNLIFSLTNGNYGTATISVQMQDDGGTANGGIDTSTTKDFTITVPIPEYVFTANVSNLAAFESFNIRLVDTTSGSNTTIALVNIDSDGNSTNDIGQLPLASDYNISIEGATTGAVGCAITGADSNGELIGSNISDHLEFDIVCP